MKEAEDVEEDQLGHDDHLHHEGGGEDLGVRVGARVPAGKSEDEEESEGKSERRWRTTGLGSEEEEEEDREIPLRISLIWSNSFFRNGIHHKYIRHTKMCNSILRTFHF